MTAGWQVVAASAVLSAGPLPPVPGFAHSRFSPLVREAVRGCLGEPGADALHGRPGDRTAVVLGTGFGDVTTHDLASERLANGLLPSPLLFYQAVPTAILGQLCHEYGITGPVTCVSALGDVAESVLPLAATLVAVEELAQALVIGVELAPSPRTVRVAAGDPRVLLPRTDAAVALLLRPGAGGAAPGGAGAEAFGGLAGLARLAEAPEDAR